MLALLVPCALLRAADLVVTSGADDGGTGTLRYLVETVAVDGDRILFDAGVTQVNLNGTQITIGDAVAIVGGGTVTLNFQDENGGFIDHQVIESRASARGISLRGGCFCNPGAGELAMAMEARCYKGGAGRTRLKVLKYTMTDLWSALVILALAAAIVADKIFMRGMWL